VVKDFRAVACGDDVVASVPEAVWRVVPPEAWITAYEEFGMIATGGKKNAPLGYERDLGACVFLKRTFDKVTAPNGEICVSARLAMQSIFKRFILTKPKHSASEIRELKIGSLMELARHGSHEYNRLSPVICGMFGTYLEPLTWDQAWNMGVRAVQDSPGDPTIPWLGFVKSRSTITAQR
jgi:hypothetical protein